MTELPIKFRCSSLPDDLVVRSIVLVERVGASSILRVTFTLQKADVDEGSLLNQRAQLSLSLSGEQEEAFYGRVVDIDYAGFVDKDHLYHVTVRSTLSKLDGGRRYRIFQAKSASDIVKQVMNDAGISDLDLSLRDSCAARDYCVQFGESDFSFVQRLCEQEGMFYAIFCENDEETIVLADSLDGLSSRSKSVQLPFVARDESDPSPKNEINEWTLNRTTLPVGANAKGYDFRTPKKPFSASSDAEGNANSGLAADSHLPARYAAQNVGDRYVKVHAEALASGATTYRARTSAMGLRAGRKFRMSQHPRDAMNREYVVLASELSVEAASARTAGGGDWRVTHVIDVAPSQDAFRLSHSAPWPVVAGPQIARVVGKAGEEVFTDEHGRVKVKFRWDPADAEDEHSSCWLRVMQSWAGASRGVSAIPRIGDEVVVGFADGNPDLPFVMGSLYNGDAKAAADLPSVPTDFVIRTRSSKQGANDTFNEIRLSDAKDQEVFGIQAQKDFSGLIKNDSKLDIKNNRSDSIGHRYTIDAGDSLEITVGQSKLTLDSAGNINMSGVNIKIDGQSTVSLCGMSFSAEGQVDATLKGVQTAVKGVMLDLTADGIASLQAALTKIG